jgi:transposase
MEQRLTLGLDIAKNTFQVHGVDESGRVVIRRRLQRDDVGAYFRELAPALIGLEACASAHHWARTLAAFGHTVKLIPAAYAKAYVKIHKNDSADAEAICEALQRPNMRFVPAKSEQQQAMLVLHRSRKLLIQQRTMTINALRGHLAEYGKVTRPGPAGASGLIQFVRNADECTLPRLARDALRLLIAQIGSLASQIKTCEEKIKRLHERNAQSQRLATIPGVGPLTATALLASMGDAALFRSARHFAAWIGLVPRQYSSGDRVKLGRISRRGDRYLRSLLYLGALGMMRIRHRKKPSFVQWAINLRARKNGRLAAIALANKMARIAWSLLRHNEDFRAEVVA